MKKQFLFSLFLLLLVFGCAEDLTDTGLEDAISIDESELFDDDCLLCTIDCPPGEICDDDPPPPPPPPPPAPPLRFQYFGMGLNSGKINTSHSTSGNGSWSSEAQISGSQVTGARTSETPYALMFQGKNFVYYKGESNSKLYYAYTNNGVTWYGNQQIGSNADTNNGPAATVLGNKVYVYHIGQTTSNIWVSKSNSNSGTSFTTNEPIKTLGGSVVTHPVTPYSVQTEQLEAITYNNTIYLFYRWNSTTDPGKMFYMTSTDGVKFSDPIPINNFRTKWGINATVHNGKIYYTWISSSNKLHVAHTTNPGTSFTSTGVNVNGVLATAYTGAGIASNGSRLVVTYKSLGSNTYYAYTDNNGSNWSGNTAAQGQIGNHTVPSLIYTGN